MATSVKSRRGSSGAEKRHRRTHRGGAAQPAAVRKLKPPSAAKSAAPARPSATGASDLVAKFIVGAPVEKVTPPISEIEAALPEGDGPDRLMVMVRDPGWVFLYWVLKGAALKRLGGSEALKRVRWSLLIRDMRGRNIRLQDIDVLAGNWYLQLAPDLPFLVDLGFLDPHGQFTLVLSGNLVNMPPRSVSGDTTEYWLALAEMPAAKAPPKSTGAASAPPAAVPGRLGLAELEAAAPPAPSSSRI